MSPWSKHSALIGRGEVSVVPHHEHMVISVMLSEAARRCRHKVKLVPYSPEDIGIITAAKIS
jgi:hypothetical protein